jgi:hypothetical protein
VLQTLRRLSLAITAGVLLALSACASSSPSAPAPAAPSAPAPLPPPASDPRVTPSADALNQYRAWIAWARRQHPYEESEARMFAVMMCESGGRPLIANPAGPYTGLFQYSNATWTGTWNTYRDRGVKSAEAQIMATALAWSLNMQSQWGCYRKTAATP